MTPQERLRALLGGGGASKVDQRSWNRDKMRRSRGLLHTMQEKDGVITPQAVNARSFGGEYRVPRAPAPRAAGPAFVPDPNWQPRAAPGGMMSKPVEAEPAGRPDPQPTFRGPFIRQE
jgi:hypothetical protein